MRVKRLNPKDSAEIQRWEDFVLKNGYMWHSSRWIDIIKNSYGFEDIYLYVEDSGGNIVSVLPLFHVKAPFFKDELVSLPHVEAAGVVKVDYFDHYEKFLIENVKFKQLTLYQFNEKIKNFPHNNIHAVFILDLPKTEEELVSLFKKKEKASFKRIFNRELRIDTGCSEKNIQRFLRLMKLKMKEFGTPWHIDKFFYNLFEVFDERITLAICSYENKDVGVGVVLVYGDTMYELYLTVPNEFRKTKSGSTLEYYFTKMAMDLKLERYSFGRSPKGSGPYEHKKRFKANEYPLNIYSFDFDEGELKPRVKPFIGQKYRWASKIVKMVPTPILNIFSGSVRKWIY